MLSRLFFVFGQTYRPYYTYLTNIIAIDAIVAIGSYR